MSRANTTQGNLSLATVWLRQAARRRNHQTGAMPRAASAEASADAAAGAGDAAMDEMKAAARAVTKAAAMHALM